MAVASDLLLMREEALRQDQVQMILRAGHRDIEKTTLSAVLPVAYTTRTGADNITRGT